jgi:hypothetical protein
MPQSSHLICDLSQAPDSPAQRLAAYRHLFAALLARVPLIHGFRFVFDAARVDRGLLDRLVALEGACCPFLHSDVSTVGEQVWWDLTVDAEEEAVPFLDALRELPDTLAGDGRDTAQPWARLNLRYRPPADSDTAVPTHGSAL